jgi:hypothetical protein
MSESLAQLRGKTQKLFAQASLNDWLARLREDCKEQVLDASEETLLGADADAWAAQLAEAFAVEPVVIRHDEVWADDQGECQVDVRHEHQTRFISDPSQPALIPGRRVVIHIPFEGNEKLLRVYGNQRSMSPPRAAIGNGEVKLVFEYPHDRRPAIKSLTDALIADIERHITWQLSDIERHNCELANFAREVIEQRRQRVLADRSHLDGLGIPVRKRADAPTTYAAPGITRRPSPTRARATRVTASPPMEPTLVGDFWGHIIGVLAAATRTMERSPADYAHWSEEQLRDNLLMLLNTHYEGDVTGETFQRAGKTDLLVRHEDRNLLVGECKWWSGAAAFTQPDRKEPSALDQLLSYTTWRDGKLALVVFVGRKDIGRVLASAHDALVAHPAVVSVADEAPEGQLRARVVAPGDEERTAELAVLFAHLPREEAHSG